MSGPSDAQIQHAIDTQGYIPTSEDRQPQPWYDLVMTACGEDPSRFDAIAAQPIYRLWFWAEGRLAKQERENEAIEAARRASATMR